MDGRAPSVRLADRIADAVAGGKLRTVEFTVQPGGKKGTALVAETVLQKARGMRGGPLGDAHDAMLFPERADVNTPMTMRGVNRNLDIAWLDEAGYHLGHMTMHSGVDVVRAPGPYRHALEMEEGGLAKFGIGDGAQVVFEDDAFDPKLVPHVDPDGMWAAPPPQMAPAPAKKAAPAKAAPPAAR